jgi:hypothetical protein
MLGLPIHSTQLTDEEFEKLYAKVVAPLISSQSVSDASINAVVYKFDIVPLSKPTVDNYTCKVCGNNKLNTMTDKSCWKCGEHLVSTKGC